jgi:hypothetical protein
MKTFLINVGIALASKTADESYSNTLAGCL